MMQVVFDQMPDDPLAGEGLRLARIAVRIWDRVRQLGDCPGAEGIPQYSPRGAQPLDKLCGGALRRVPGIPLAKSAQYIAIKAQSLFTPARSCADDMPTDLLEAAQTLCATLAQLFCR